MQNSLIPLQNDIRITFQNSEAFLSDISSSLTAVYRFIDETLLPQFAWPAFTAVWEKYRSNRLGRSRADTDILPVMACLAAGGEMEQALPVAASWTLYILAGRIFDDLVDGEGEDAQLFSSHEAPSPISACLFAVSAANAALAYLEDTAVHKDVAAAFNHTLALAVKSEYERPLLPHPSLEAYFETIAAKTGLVFATGVWAGGRAATDDQKILAALHKFGLHLGMMTQILDDCMDLKTDLAHELWTLPLLYALAQESHPLYKPLRQLLERQQATPAWAAEVAPVLYEMGAVSWSLQIAEAHRRQAVSVIETLPSDLNGLMHYVTPKSQ